LGLVEKLGVLGVLRAMRQESYLLGFDSGLSAIWLANWPRTESSTIHRPVEPIK
jgi:hypothetical protein